MLTRDFRDLLLTENPDAVVVTKPDGQVAFWNKGAEALFAYVSEEAVGRPISDLIIRQTR